MTKPLKSKNALFQKIIHVDLDAFYAQVEQVLDRRLRGKPVVVGGSPQGRGVVATASYEARRYGIRSAMPSQEAARRCPQAIFVRPQFKKYQEFSQKIRAIFKEVTDQVEPLSLDEAYLDVTQNHWNEPSASIIAQKIRQKILDQTGLTASAGVAPLKFLAKIASDYQKPNGLTVIPPSQMEDFVKKLPVEKLWSVGPATAERFHKYGIETVLQLKKCPSDWVEDTFGKHGLFLYRLAHCQDSRKIQSRGKTKSIGAERTFSKNLIQLPQILKELESLSEHIASRIQRKSFLFKTIQIKVRATDFSTFTRARTILQPEDQGSVIYAVAQELYKNFQQEGAHGPIRLLGVQVSGLMDRETQIQLQFPLSDS